VIIEYNRPTTIEEALRLLNRAEPRTLPMGGGTVLNQPSDERLAVVDLQGLGLNRLQRNGNMLRVGATTTLQALLVASEIPPGLRQPLRCEAALNIRQAATIAGSVCAGEGRSPFLAALLALDAGLEFRSLERASQTISLGEWLPMRGNRIGELIVAVNIPINIKMAYQYVARTPADLPIIGAEVVKWPAGRTRLVLCGWGQVPHLAMDGPEAGGIELAAQNAASRAADEWASAEYRQAIAGILALRALLSLED